MLQGKNAEGQLYLKQALAIDPSVYDFHYWLALSLEISKDKAGARREYQEALRLNPDSTETKLRLKALARQ